MITETHAEAAQRLLTRARQLRASSRHPDAAGSAIREGWAKTADALLAESQVEASLAALEPSTNTEVVRLRAEHLALRAVATAVLSSVECSTRGPDVVLARLLRDVLAKTA